MNFKDLDNLCKKIRKNILIEIGTFGAGHIGGSFSIVELLTVLYSMHMNIDPKNPNMGSRDRLIVSKGHSGPAVYSVLCEMGYFDKSWLLTLNQSGTKLPSHCDMNKTPGIDMTTGSLGQGFSCAVGVAEASKLRRDGAKIYTIIGDGESQEGQIWEAGMFASHHKLDNLIAFTDYNNSQLDGSTRDICDIDPIDKKWEAFGWNVFNVQSGNDCENIDLAIKKCKEISNGKPNMVILNTKKGYGISFIEETGFLNHSMSISEEMLEKGIKELEEESF